MIQYGTFSRLKKKSSGSVETMFVVCGYCGEKQEKTMGDKGHYLNYCKCEKAIIENRILNEIESCRQEVREMRQKHVDSQNRIDFESEVAALKVKYNIKD